MLLFLLYLHLILRFPVPLFILDTANLFGCCSSFLSYPIPYLSELICLFCSRSQSFEYTFLFLTHWMFAFLKLIFCAAPFSMLRIYRLQSKLGFTKFTMERHLMCCQDIACFFVWCMLYLFGWMKDQLIIRFIHYNLGIMYSN